MTIADAYRWSAFAVAIGMTGIAGRHLAGRRQFADDGLYPWRLSDYAHLLGPVFPVLSPPGFTIVLVLRLAASVCTVLTAAMGSPSAVAATVLLCTSLVKTARLPLASEEAEVMNLTVLVPLTFHLWRPEDPVVGEAGLWFIALQAAIAYVATGISKLGSGAWRSGVALPRILDGALARNPGLARVLEEHGGLARFVCRGTIALEVLLPFTLLAPPPLAWLLLGAGALFHIGIALALGLGSFLWAFLAAYAAVLFVNARVATWLWAG